MAINTTNGLPSFSEMYSAFKTRGDLSQVVNAGVTGAEEGYKMRKAGIKSDAEAAEAQAKAKAALQPKAQNVLLESLTPDEKVRLQDQAQPNEQAQLVVPWQSVVALRGGQAATLKQENEKAKQASDAEKLALQQKHADESAKQNQIIAALQQEKLGLSANAQAATADANVIAATKNAKPDMMDKGLGMLGKAVGKVSPQIGSALTPDVLEQARMKQEAIKRQEARGGGQAPSVTPSPEGLMATPPAPAPAPVKRSPRNAGKPVAVYTQEDINALPDGSPFIDGSGKVKVKRTVNGQIIGEPVK